MPDDPPAPPATPSLPLDAVVSAIGNSARWRILAQLATGDQLMVAELAERTGQSADAVSKHMALLRDAGIVTVGRNRLYQLQPQFIADKSQRLVDFGWCLLRLSAAA